MYHQTWSLEKVSLFDVGGSEGLANALTLGRQERYHLAVTPATVFVLF